LYDVRPLLLLFLLPAFAGCTGGGKLVDKPVAPSVQPEGAVEEGTLPDPPKIEESTAPIVDPEAPLELRLVLTGGRKETYVLINDTVTQTRGQTGGPMRTTTSFLNAKQEVTVRNDGTVRIHTTDVKGGVQAKDQREVEADGVMKQFAADIEGSVLQGVFDKRGRGAEMFLLGDGVGLNPMGPQSGAQEVMVGFMGVLLPEKPAKRGDKWTSAYDITESAIDLFAGMGAMVDNGKVAITYELIEFNHKNNSVRIKVSSAGKPVVKIPIEGGALTKIQMNVTSVGEALVRLDDGWLQELRLETTVVTEGFVATKVTTRTVTRKVN
jgi:hypothetical protein